ncbi:MAG: hypothetical protein ACXIUP_09960, partial [Microcella sp.]
DVSKALATIAAKTVHHDSDPAVDAPAAPADAPTESAPQSPTVAEKATAPAATDNPAEILDIPLPVTNGGRKRRAVDPSTAEQLLGSVLESLPEPPAPGTRKRASRRATSGTITAAPSTTEETANS